MPAVPDDVFKFLERALAQGPQNYGWQKFFGGLQRVVAGLAETCSR
jgi:hypothetical protein